MTFIYDIYDKITKHHLKGGKGQNIMVRYAGTLDKAVRIERQNARTKWDDLVELLKDGGYPIKMDNDNSLLLSIDGEPYADIEVYFTGNNGQDFVSIHLWHYQFVNPDFEVKYMREPVSLYGNLVDAVTYINELYTVTTVERWQS